MATVNDSNSPFNKVFTEGLKKLEGFGVPKTVTGAIRTGFETAQGKVQGGVEDLKNFSAAGILRARVTKDFLLDQLDGKQFQATSKTSKVQAAVPLTCTIVPGEDGAKIVGVDPGGSKREVGTISIDEIQRFKARAAGVRICLEADVFNEKTLMSLNKVFQSNDRHFGQLEVIHFDIPKEVKAAAASFLENNYLKVAPEQKSSLQRRDFMVNESKHTQYYGVPPRPIDLSANELIEITSDNVPEVAKACTVLRKFAEKTGLKGPSIAGSATTDGWWVMNMFGAPCSSEGWGFEPKYQAPKCEIDSLQLKK